MDVEVRSVEVRNDAKVGSGLLDGDQEAQIAHDNIHALERLTKASIFIVILSIAHIIIASLHTTWDQLTLNKVLIASGSITLVGAIITIIWAKEAKKAHKKTTELFQPRVSDGFTRTVFILSLLIALGSAALFLNILVQKDYSEDYADAQNTTQSTWESRYGTRTLEGLVKYFKISFITQLVFLGIYAIFYLWAARASFKLLRWDNQTISQLVFLGCFLLLAFGLSLIYFSHHAYGYGDFPQIRAHFPIWNIKALFFLGIAVCVLSFVGFLVDHRSWRIGFLVLTFLLAFTLILLGNFTLFAFRNTRQTYLYYKGTVSQDTCHNRMNLVNYTELQGYGCPIKYIDYYNCTDSQKVHPWEDRMELEPNRSPVTQKASTTTTTTKTAQPAAETTTTTEPAAPAADLMFATTSSSSDAYYYGVCLNTQCCGLLGQRYTRDLLGLANVALLTILSSVLILIGCGYFFYVNWVDTARNKKLDYIWLTFKLAAIIAFIVVFAKVNWPYVDEQLSSSYSHY